MQYRTLKYLFLFIFLLRLALAALMPPGTDEAYYFAYTLHPALSYFDHPPMVAIFGGIIPHGLDWISPLSIRLMSVIMFSFAVYTLYMLASLYSTKEKAAMCAAVFTTVPMFFVISGTMLLPDASLSFFWILGLYIFKITMDSPRSRNWLLFGAVAGLGLLSKYTAGFLFIGMGLYLLIHPGKRKYLLSPGPYLSAATAAIVFLPVIIWNINHDFASFSFQSGRVGIAEIEFRYFYQSLLGQMGYLLPFFFFPAIYFSVKSVFFLKKDPDFQALVFSFGAVPLFFFIFASFFEKVLPHWPIIAYMTLVLPAGAFFSEFRKKNPAVFGACAFTHMAIVTGVVIIALLQINTGLIMNKEVPKSTEPGEVDTIDITADIIGWDRLKDYVHENYEEEKIFMFSHKWYICCHMSFAMNGRYDVLCLGDMKNARGYGIWQDQQKWIGKDGLYTCTENFCKDPAERYSDYFENIFLEKKLPVYRSGTRIKIIYVYRCEGFKKPFPTDSSP